MLSEIARFELRYQIASPVFIAAVAIIGLLAFGGVTLEQVQVGATAAVHVNSPHAIMQNVLVWSLFGMIIPTAFLSSAILRDAAFKTEGLVFTTQITEPSYLIGRFLGGALATALAFLIVPLAILVGAAMPWLDPETIGPLVLSHYLYAYFLFGLPNLLVAGLILVTIANITRSSLATYTGLLALLVLYFIGASIGDQPQYRDLAALLDPFGLSTYGEAVRYYTPAELNAQLPPLEGALLANRLTWIGGTLALFALNVVLFRFRRGGLRLFKRRRRVEEAAYAPTPIALPRVAQRTDAGMQAGQFAARIGFEIKTVVLNVAFWVLLGLGLFNALGALLTFNSLYGTPNYPVTRVMIDLITNSFTIMPFVVVIYYAAELIWRERAAGFHEVVDATPTPSWVFVLSKFLALTIVLIGLFGVAMSAAIIVQLIRGYTDLELGQYALRLFVDFGLPFAMLAALALFAQVITNNRWLGMLVVLAIFIAILVMSNLGFEHNLYIYGAAPTAPYSDMNGYGHFLGITLWFHLYWGAIAGLLLILAFLLWNRGALTPILRRLRGLPRALTPVSGGAAAALALIAIGSGSWIFYNTNVLNEYRTSNDVEALTAEFERTYRDALLDLPQPKIADISVDVDIYPRERRVETRGRYLIENREAAPIDRVWIRHSGSVDIRSLVLEGADLAEHDETHRLYAFDFETPLQPGETRTLTFETVMLNPGFRNSGNVSSVVYNGTFFNNRDVLPRIGISRSDFVSGRSARRRQGLDPIERTYPLEDESRWTTNYISTDADFVMFRTTVSTTPDQIAVAPGTLEREWVEDGRRYFEYALDAPSLNFFSWLSAEYKVTEDMWNDVRLQVFHHAPHDWNVDRMLEASRDSLAYFSEAFSPYQYDQFRIFEFPSYNTFAQAFPNSIPYSEGIGFIADLRDPEDIDYVYYVSAHEAAHQWWAHQVMAADVQGGVMLVESFAQYAALMVMEREYGEDAMRRFLKFELDSYLSGRGGETREEMPLYRVEGQDYIHYRKGAVIMYALQDYLGEDVVNRTLARLIELRGFQGEPYATTLDFLRLLREEAGPEWDGLITDFFERIVLFDLSVTDAVVRPLEDGRYEVVLDVEARKFAAEGDGSQSEEPIDYLVDLGVFTRNLDGAIEGSNHVLHLEKHRVNETEMQFTLIVDQRPQWVGIDPYNKLIDRNSDDNLFRVRIEDGE